jgi:hypothetical protein
VRRLWPVAPARRCSSHQCRLAQWSRAKFSAHWLSAVGSLAWSKAVCRIVESFGEGWHDGFGQCRRRGPARRINAAQRSGPAPISERIGCQVLGFLDGHRRFAVLLKVLEKVGATGLGAYRRRGAVRRINAARRGGPAPNSERIDGQPVGFLHDHRRLAALLKVLEKVGATALTGAASAAPVLDAV